MIRGLYIAGTLMTVNEKVLETVGNNVANIDTAGFKRDEVGQESFNDILITKYNGSNISLESNFDGIKVKEDRPNFYEVETKGGYFITKTDAGSNYSKSLKFTVDKDGFLSTYFLNSDKLKDDNLGDRVIGRKGPIFVGTQEFKINKDGSVSIGGQTVDNLVKFVSKDVIGSMGSGVRAERVVTDHSQGNLMPTGNMFDFALKGEGFFEMKTSFGTMFTRSGSFTLDNQKRLVNNDGFPVQGFNGDIIIENGQASVNEYGEIISNNTIIDKLKVVNFTNKGDLRKVGLGMFKFSDEPTGKKEDVRTNVVQGSIEQSNVNAISEMIRMMSVQRDYENGQKLIKTIDETIQRAVNEVGTLR